MPVDMLEEPFDMFDAMALVAAGIVPFDMPFDMPSVDAAGDVPFERFDDTFTVTNGTAGAGGDGGGMISVLSWWRAFCTALTHSSKLCNVALSHPSANRRRNERASSGLSGVAGGGAAGMPALMSATTLPGAGCPGAACELMGNDRYGLCCMLSVTGTVSETASGCCKRRS